MKLLTLLAASLCVFLFSCTSDSNSASDTFEVYCEMVANDAKPIAISRPISYKKMNQKWDSYQRIAAKYEVKVYREHDFPVTPLFPSDLTQGKEVVVIYRDPRLRQYMQLKSDLPTIEPMLAARRLGRILGYCSRGANRLLMKNSRYRTLESFGVEQQVTHLYYERIDEAIAFYKDVLKLVSISERKFQIGVDALIELHEVNASHPANQPKATAIALLTDQLAQWYAYMQEEGIEIKYAYKPRQGGPHDGFVAIDPGGYLLEFEQFKQHPENELFMAMLEAVPKVVTGADSLKFYASITWTYHKDVLKVQNFYEQELGFRLVADQGWTKIFQTSPSGFVGLVDACRGMMDYAEEKAVEIEWKLKSSEEALGYFKTSSWWEDHYLMGPEGYRYLIN